MYRSRFAKASLLVVDDDSHLSDLLKFLLEGYGFEVHLAASGQAALASFEERATEIDLVILDLRLTDMSGVETFRALRSLRGDLPAILMTAHPEMVDQKELAGAGFLGVFTKPLKVPSLVDMIHKALKIQ